MPNQLEGYYGFIRTVDKNVKHDYAIELNSKTETEARTQSFSYAVCGRAWLTTLLLGALASASTLYTPSPLTPPPRAAPSVMHSRP